MIKMKPSKNNKLKLKLKNLNVLVQIHTIPPGCPGIEFSWTRPDNTLDLSLVGNSVSYPRPIVISFIAREEKM